MSCTEFYGRYGEIFSALREFTISDRVSVNLESNRLIEIDLINFGREKYVLVSALQEIMKCKFTFQNYNTHISYVSDDKCVEVDKKD